MVRSPSRRIPRIIIGILVATLGTIACLEALFTWLDPWGVVTYYSDIEYFFADNTEPDPALEYRAIPGKYSLRRWSFQINEDGGRNLPANHKSACKIAFLGDSVTFGWGINDADTWVNQVAGQFPAVEFFNPALPGYNIGSIVRLRQRYDASAYIYVLINNDDEPLPLGIKKSGKPALRRYLEFALYSGVLFDFERPKTHDLDGIVDVLATDPKLTIVGFSGNPLTERISKRYPQVIVLPVWSHAISVADGHPNLQSGQEIAREMIPIVTKLVKDHCG